jgi:hypothetical protein
LLPDQGTTVLREQRPYMRANSDRFRFRFASQAVRAFAASGHYRDGFISLAGIDAACGHRMQGRRQLSKQGSCDTIRALPIMNYMPPILATEAILAVFAFAAEVSRG